MFSNVAVSITENDQIDVKARLLSEDGQLIPIASKKSKSLNETVFLEKGWFYVFYVFVKVGRAECLSRAVDLR